MGLEVTQDNAKGIVADIRNFFQLLNTSDFVEVRK